MTEIPYDNLPDPTVQPYTSPHDKNPYNSNAPGPGSAQPITSAEQAVPDLAMYWTKAPDIIATPAQSGGSGGGPPPDNSLDNSLTYIGVEFHGIYGSEQSMLDAASTVVSAYEALKTQYGNVRDYVFGQQATSTYIQNNNTGNSETDTNTSSGPDPIQPTAHQFADGQNGQPGMNAVQAQALQQIADSMAVVGEFIATMNAVARNYATADAQSVLPDSPDPLDSSWHNPPGSSSS